MNLETTQDRSARGGTQRAIGTLRCTRVTRAGLSGVCGSCSPIAPKYTVRTGRSIIIVDVLWISVPEGGILLYKRWQWRGKRQQAAALRILMVLAVLAAVLAVELGEAGIRLVGGRGGEGGRPTEEDACDMLELAKDCCAAVVATQPPWLPLELSMMVGPSPLFAGALALTEEADRLDRESIPPAQRSLFPQGVAGAAAAEEDRANDAASGDEDDASDGARTPDSPNGDDEPRAPDRDAVHAASNRRRGDEDDDGAKRSRPGSRSE